MHATAAALRRTRWGLGGAGVLRSDGLRASKLRSSMSLRRRYNPQQIEPKWQEVWAREGTWTVSNKPAGAGRGHRGAAEKSYVLEMLPYPSGEPHIGHLKNYALGDAIAHFRRRTGRRVLHPMGYDAFGLPAENYAIATGVQPRESTDQSIAAFRRATTAGRSGSFCGCSSVISRTASRRPSSGVPTTRPCSPTSR